MESTVFEIISKLDLFFPKEIEFLPCTEPFRFLLTVILSGYSTDKMAAISADKLFGAYPDPHAIANAEREDIGVSTAWLHHKGRNRHHYEHWVDYSLDGEHVIMGAQMPRKYVAEMVMDRISASRTYLGDKYTNQEPLNYYLKSKEKLWFVHPQTKKELEGLLRILHDHGEKKTLWYIKNVYLKKELH